MGIRILNQLGNLVPEVSGHDKNVVDVGLRNEIQVPLHQGLPTDDLSDLRGLWIGRSCSSTTGEDDGGSAHGIRVDAALVRFVRVFGCEPCVVPFVEQGLLSS